MTGLLILIPIIIALTIFITNYNSKNKKDKKTDVFENKFTKDESEFVILLGSETSSTSAQIHSELSFLASHLSCII